MKRNDRRGTDKDNKRNSKTNATANPQPALTFDEFVEAAMDAEEKGERYKEGDKALRFFETAAQNYSSALSLQRDSAALYNLGRLLLLLAEFRFPVYPDSQKRRLLLDARANLKESINLTNSVTDNVGAADARFNLSQVNKALVELVLDSDVTAVSHTDFELLSEADVLLDETLALQIAELQKSASCSGGDNCGHDHSHDNKNGDNGMEEISEGEQHHQEAVEEEQEQEFEIGQERDPVTPQTIIETLVEHASLLTLAASALYPISPVQADGLYAKADAKISETTLYWCDMTPSNEPSDVSLGRATLLVSRGESLFEASSKTEATSSEWTRLFELASNLYDGILTRHPTCAEAPADKGDLLCTWAEFVMTCTIGSAGIPGFDALINNVIAEQQHQALSSSSSSSNQQSLEQKQQTAHSLLANLRQMYARAAKSYTLAQTLEPTKPSISSRLADLEATRTALYPTTLTPTNIATQQTLLKNAATHYKRTLETLGVNMSLLSAQKGCPDDAIARQSAARGQEALSKLKSENLGHSVKVLEIDVSNPNSIKQAFENLKIQSPVLDVLINNAGISISGGTTPEIFNVNVDGVKNTVEAFTPILSPSGYIINVSSTVGSAAQHLLSSEVKAILEDIDGLSWDKLANLAADYQLQPTSNKHEWPAAQKTFGAYGISKSLLTAYTRRLAVDKPGLRVVAICPGYCATDLTGFAAGTRSAAEGATSVIWPLLNPEFTNGLLYQDGKVQPFSVGWNA
ncbi:hypothetical protein HK100_004645 [Physocladia obscura]|uniref:Uncharacterized protein n=1 Tax=Physocladia obscura TaxID=109957 RepID=A0AAD5T773_9FUNG|nr:hypothetical protein HK100_004645 [Physocladia obscura]